MLSRIMVVKNVYQETGNRSKEAAENQEREK